MPNPIKGFQTKDGVRKYDYNELENLPENDPDDLALEVEEVKENIEAKKANIDGYYQDMTVGDAEQLLATVGNEDGVPYNFRTSGGTIDIGDRETDMVVGGTICWNQLFNVGFSGFSSLAITKSTSGAETSITSASDSTEGKGLFLANNGLINGHVYYACCVFKTDSESYAALGFRKGGVSISDSMDGSMGWSNTETYARMERICVVKDGSIFGIFLRNDTPSGGSATFKNVQLFDLTQMFGSAVANHIHNLEAARLGDGVAWFKKLFPKDYYEYNTGELMSVKTSAHKMVGFNAWDEEWEVGAIAIASGENIVSATAIRSKNFCSCVPNANYNMHFVDGATHYVFWYDESKNYIYFSSASAQNKVITSPNNARYFKIRNDAVTKANDICINLSWDGERDGEYEPYEERVYPLDSSLELRGIPKLDSANNLYYDGDTYESDGTVTRKYVTKTITSDDVTSFGTASTGVNYASLAFSNYGGMDNGNAICDKYQVVIGSAPQTSGFFRVTGGSMYFYDNAFTDLATAKQILNGITIVYEVTPTTETAEPYQNPQIVNDFGTEEYVDERAVPIPVGHQTKYLANLRAKLEMAPDSPSADGEYIVKQTNGQNEYIALGSSTTMQSIMAKLPNPPSEDGTYTLKVTVANGTATYSWEA